MYSVYDMEGPSSMQLWSCVRAWDALKYRYITSRLPQQEYDINSSEVTIRSYTYYAYKSGHYRINVCRILIIYYLSTSTS